MRMNKNITWVKNEKIRLMRLDLNKKASLDEQQNQTAIATNNSYIKNFISIWKFFRK